MLDLIFIGHILQIFLTGMSLVNIVLGIRLFITDGSPKDASIMVVYGMLYGLASMTLGLHMLTLLK